MERSSVTGSTLGLDEAFQSATNLFDFDEEAVVPVFAADNLQLTAKEFARHMLGNELLSRDWEEAIAVQTKHESLAGDFRKSSLYALPAPTYIVRVHRVHKSDVAICIEPADKLIAVEIQVALDRELAALGQWAHLRAH